MQVFSPVLLKIGGSVLTNEEGINIDEIRRVASEIASAWFKTNENIAIVHGAGSCGHPEADKYKINDHNNSMRNSKGMYATHRAVMQLNKVFLESLFEENVPIVPITPLSMTITEDARIKVFNLGAITRAFMNSMVPVLHGDVVFDDKWGVRILSGDQIIVYLASVFSPTRVGMATNVNGVYLDGVKLDRVTDNNVNKVLGQPMISGKKHDVTGGMPGKIKELCGLPERTLIFNGTIKYNINDFLTGLPVFGTFVKVNKHLIVGNKVL